MKTARNQSNKKSPTDSETEFRTGNSNPFFQNEIKNQAKCNSIKIKEDQPKGPLINPSILDVHFSPSGSSNLFKRLSFRTNPFSDKFINSDKSFGNTPFNSGIIKSGYMIV
jgi:hypothetical protein